MTKKKGKKVKKVKLESYFDEQEYLEHAFTHKSWVNEHPGVRTSNERLEFLGDAVLEFVVSKELYEKFPNEQEGYLTALRANLVNTVNLARAARKHDVGEKLLLSKGEEAGGGRDNSSLLADTMEAIIGALYLDRGVRQSEKFIHEVILSDLDEVASEPLKDPKSRLQELVQAHGYEAPKYEVIKESGPDHDKEFVTQVVIDGESWADGKGKNKSSAAQSAAENALEVCEKKFEDE